MEMGDSYLPIHVAEPREHYPRFVVKHAHDRVCAGITEEAGRLRMSSLTLPSQAGVYHCLQGVRNNQ